MSFLSPNDFLVILGYPCIMFGSKFGPQGDATTFYETNRVPFQPPGWVILWTDVVLYLMIAAAGVMYYLARPYDVWQFQLGNALLVFNILVNKLWTPLFFVRRAYWAAALVMLLVLLSGVGTSVMAAWIGSVHVNSFAWIAFGLFTPFVPWSAYILVMTVQHAVRSDPKPPHRRHHHV